MSISKLVDDHNTTGLALVSIRDRFRLCSRDSSGGRITRKRKGMQRRRTELSNRHCYDSPSGVAISLVPLWFPWWFYVVKYLRIAKMIYGVRGVYEISHNCYFSKNRSAAASLFAINNGFPIVQFMRQPFLNIFRQNYFGLNLQILSVRKGRFFRPLNKSSRISAAAESSAT